MMRLFESSLLRCNGPCEFTASAAAGAMVGGESGFFEERYGEAGPARRHRFGLAF